MNIYYTYSTNIQTCLQSVVFRGLHKFSTGVFIQRKDYDKSRMSRQESGL